MNLRSASLILTLTLGLTACSAPVRLLTVDELTDAEASSRVSARLGARLEACKAGPCALDLDRGANVDTVFVDRVARSLEIHFNDALAHRPFRLGDAAVLEQLVGEALDPLLGSWTTELRVLDHDPAWLVPNVFAENGGSDAKRWPEQQEGRLLTSYPDRPWRSQAQLSGRHAALWPSHGWYYEERLDRWEWQRARLFQTVEDLFPLSFVVPYLAPMLENAGAYVHMPRERDVQTAEVVVDADGQWIRDRSGRLVVPSVDAPVGTPTGNRYLEVAERGVAWQRAATPGFRALDMLVDENPFEEGHHRVAPTTREPLAVATWIPDLPQAGTYAVHVSWGRTERPAPDARYTVHHLGGSTEIRVDQGMMAGTWVYLGTYRFAEGQRPESGRVELTNQSRLPGTSVSADAVRFGGGVGHVARAGKTSGRPRFTEGARYWMQYAGFPAALVYNVTESSNDYVDDYRSRAEWVNYLRGAPLGPNKDRSTPGLGVPVDLSLAFHTDAGVTASDSTIGTLLIYSSTGTEGERAFPSGFSRFANRDLADGMQTQIVDDIRALYDSTWTRRALWDRDYSEAVRPNVPGVLLELLSHQNFADMRFGLDPRFRFDVARAVYKSMVRFLADQHGFDAVIQPLPPDHLAVRWEGAAAHLSWQSVSDPLEPTAEPTAWVVYVRTVDGDFDNGRMVAEPQAVIEGLAPGSVHGFRVTAVNAGGESFPSETVAAARAADGAPTALIVAGFDRISGPGTMESGTIRGFSGIVDEGVPDGYDLSYIGEQYDFMAGSPWMDDDSPGHGASWSTWETRVLRGNTFDYPLIHAEALLAAGLSSVTVSDEVLPGWVQSGRTNGMALVDVILGEEKRTEGPGRRLDFEALPDQIRAALDSLMQAGTPLLISGAHVATDAAGPGASESSASFARDRLGFIWRTDRAVQRGRVAVLEGLLPGPANLAFNTDPAGSVYRVEHPDALDPAPGAETLMRYRDNNMSAAVGQPGRSVVMGFPFETLTDEAQRLQLMRALVHYLTNESE
ncbi:MAG: xanthan lyase [Bacteroidetes bacterium]|nr:xanthan lyase [Bacteroidota bacterium]